MMIFFLTTTKYQLHWGPRKISRKLGIQFSIRNVNTNLLDICSRQIFFEVQAFQTGPFISSCSIVGICFVLKINIGTKAFSAQISPTYQGDSKLFIEGRNYLVLRMGHNIEINSTECIRQYSPGLITCHVIPSYRGRTDQIIL